MNTSIRTLRHCLAAAIAASAIAMPLAAAAAPTADFSDLWFNPAEPGWGVNVIQQDDTLFVTLFVYAANGTPTWYVASAVTRNNTGETFSGALYRTTGPYFGAAFNGPVSISQVGTLTFATTQVNSATLTYSVDGVPVTKNIQRQTWDTENIAGTYFGATAGNWLGCGSSRDGYRETASTFVIAQDGSSIQLREEIGGATCSYNGTYSQSGRMGSIQGGGICGDGVNQAFAATEVQMTRISLAMQLNVAQPTGCRFTGRMSAVRRGS